MKKQEKKKKSEKKKSVVATKKSTKVKRRGSKFIRGTIPNFSSYWKTWMKLCGKGSLKKLDSKVGDFAKSPLDLTEEKLDDLINSLVVLKKSVFEDQMKHTLKTAKSPIIATKKGTPINDGEMYSIMEMTDLLHKKGLEFLALAHFGRKAYKSLPKKLRVILDERWKR